MKPARVGGDVRVGGDIVDEQLPDQPSPAVVAEGGHLELVGPRFGDGVQGAAGEAGLADVEGRDLQPELLDRLERDHASPGASPGDVVGRETEDILVDRAVHVEGVEAVVGAGHRHPFLRHACEGRERGEVDEVAGQRREFAQGFGSDQGRDADPARVEDQVRFRLDHQFLEVDGLRHDGDVKIDEPPQEQLHGFALEVPESDAHDTDHVGAAGALAAERVTPVGEAQRCVGGSRPAVGQGDLRPLYGVAPGVGDVAPEPRRGGALGGQDGGAAQAEGEKESGDCAADTVAVRHGTSPLRGVVGRGWPRTSGGGGTRDVEKSHRTRSATPIVTRIRYGCQHRYRIPGLRVPPQTLQAYLESGEAGNEDVARGQSPFTIDSARKVQPCPPDPMPSPSSRNGSKAKRYASTCTEWRRRYATTPASWARMKSCGAWPGCCTTWTGRGIRTSTRTSVLPGCGNSATRRKLSTPS